jgi:hypothetical protein
VMSATFAWILRTADKTDGWPKPGKRSHPST